MIFLLPLWEKVPSRDAKADEGSLSAETDPSSVSLPLRVSDPPSPTRGEGKGRSIHGSCGLWLAGRGADMTASEVTSETNTSANSTGVYLAVLQLVFTL